MPLPSTRRRTLTRVLVALALVTGLACVLAGVTVWRFPLASLAWAGRSALRWSGFEKTQVATRFGHAVYFRAGRGTPLVFIHGVNDQAGTWARVAPSFTSDHRVIVVDLAGHGESDPRQGPLPMRDLIDGLSAVVDAEARDERVTLVGNSLGGFLALAHAVNHPGRVRQAILVNGAVDRGDNMRAAVILLPTSRDEARRTMAALMSPRSPRMPEFVLDDLVRRAPTSPLARLMAQPERAFDEFLIDDRLDRVRLPVTMIWGEDDRLLSVSYARQAAARLPDARLETLRDCGHMPQRECPGALLARLREALTRAARPPQAAFGGV
jgi:pimeloyl-ACP methyl ester carboxylesterase